MFDIYCSSCDHAYIVGTRSLTAFRNTNGAPVARARCPRGHDVIVDFSSAQARRPAGVAAALALQEPAHAA